MVAEAVIAGIAKANKDNEGLSVMTENVDSGNLSKTRTLLMQDLLVTSLLNIVRARNHANDY